MELAIILPVMLLLAVAAIDLGRLFYAQITVENAAREGALTAAVLADDPDRLPGRHRLRPGHEQGHVPGRERGGRAAS